MDTDTHPQTHRCPRKVHSYWCISDHSEIKGQGQKAPRCLMSGLCSFCPHCPCSPSLPMPFQGPALLFLLDPQPWASSSKTSLTRCWAIRLSHRAHLQTRKSFSFTSPPSLAPFSPMSFSLPPTESFSPSPVPMSFIFKDFMYLFLEKGKGREKDRSMNVWLPVARPSLGTWPAIQTYVLTGSRIGDPLVLRLALSPLSHARQGQPFYCIVKGLHETLLEGDYGCLWPSKYYV